MTRTRLGHIGSCLIVKPLMFVLNLWLYCIRRALDCVSNTLPNISTSNRVKGLGKRVQGGKPSFLLYIPSPRAYKKTKRPTT
jgi:hypothetical protein